ncbi:DNA polymerase III subunit beta [Haploplasma modicum]|jgi:DNA polymerase III subunit beta|uniref:DNA polymerase III subunit beta n=1 Tax=Haploplasma modicum TaxID=2150 RepID=UPI000479D53A|nr:DNA polymerase III subunit beta [Haploplasma modicum]MCR1809304.1 DNA polymerase III subunit beta [Haploplasma modicum]
MIFSIDRETLLENLIIMQKALPNKTSLPILTNIKFDVKEDHIILTSNNTDIAIQVLIEEENLKVKKSGVVVVPGKYLIDIVRKVNSKHIEFTLIEDRIIVIKADRSEFKLRLMDYREYPEVDFLTNVTEPLTIDVELLKSIIRETSYAASTNEKRPILTGVNFKFNNNELHVVATNSYRLSQKILKIRSNIDNFDIVIPSKSLDELSKILDTSLLDVQIYVSINKILFKIGNVLFQSSLLEGTYPNTSRIIPTDFAVVIPFNKDELLQTVERVSLLSPKDKETNYNIIKFKLNNDHTVEITSNNQEIGDANEVILPSGDIKGSIINIAFSSRHLIEALKTFNAVDVNMNFAGEIKPFVVNTNEDPTLLHLILPVRID